jgi:hypothetical protein
MVKNTAICPVCHQEYEFSNAYTDRCPICCPKEKSDDIWRDDLMQESDWSDIPDEPAE